MTVNAYGHGNWAVRPRPNHTLWWRGRGETAWNGPNGPVTDSPLPLAFDLIGLGWLYFPGVGPGTNLIYVRPGETSVTVYYLAWSTDYSLGGDGEWRWSPPPALKWARLELRPVGPWNMVYDRRGDTLYVGSAE